MFFINKITNDDYDDPRREFLVKLLSSGAFAAGAGSSILQPAYGQVLGAVPRKMPDNRSFFEITGAVTVNGQKADRKMLLRGNEVIKTGARSQAIFVVGQDAFILREKSELELAGDNLLLNTLRLVSGKLLSVFGKRRPKQSALNLKTTVATVGIRGTGVYCEAAEEQTYLCTCYGETSIAANNDKKSRVNIAASYHDEPKYILRDAPEGKKIVKAPVINHTDLELLLVEELVGRKPAFASGLKGYSSPRRSY